MKVNVIGTSCTWFERKNTSFVIDDSIVFDVPEGAYKDVIKVLNNDIFKIKAVIISHLHLDHVGSAHALFTRYLRTKPDDVPPLKVYAPSGMLEKIAAYKKMFFGSPDESNIESFIGKVEMIDLYDGMEFDVGEYTIKTYKVEHGLPESFGFTFTNKSGLTVGFSGDTRLCDNLEKIIKSSNYAFIELSSTQPHKSHICVDEYNMLRKKYKNTEFYPVHTSDECQKYVEDNNLNALNDGDVINFKE